MKHSISIKTANGVLTVDNFKAQGMAKSDVIGVVLQTEVIGVIIALDQCKAKWCSKDNCEVFNKACDEAETLQTLDGLELTRNIVKQNREDGEEMTAAMYCWDYNKGGLQWYLPSLYELGTITAYRDEVNEVLKMLDADLFNAGDWGWSSSERYSGYAWFVNFSTGFFNSNDKCSALVVRAVSAFSQLQRGGASSPSGNVDYSQLSEKAVIEYLRQLGYGGELTKKIKL